MGTKRVGLARIEALMENLKRELNMNGATWKGTRRPVTTITATKSDLAVGDSGTMYLLDAADETGAVTITLPQLSTALVGTTYTFCVTDPSDSGFLIQTGDLTDTTGDMYIGGITLSSDAVSSTSNAPNGRIVAPGANDAVIHLDGNLANSGGEVGTTITVTAVSATQWYVEGVVVTDDADSNGTALFQNN